MLEALLEQALVVRTTSLMEIARSDLVAEQAAMQTHLDQVTSLSRFHLEAGLADAELALQRAEGLMASEYSDELARLVSTQRRVFREHGKILEQEAKLTGKRGSNTSNSSNGTDKNPESLPASTQSSCRDPHIWKRPLKLWHRSETSTLALLPPLSNNAASAYIPRRGPSWY